jgi:nitrate reductase gamma subunit
MEMLVGVAIVVAALAGMLLMRVRRRQEPQA